MDDIILNKSAIIERCLRRVREEYRLCPDLDNPTHVDAIGLNLERACQAAIDMAMHCIAGEQLGVPQTNAEAFELLSNSGKIDTSLSKALKSMVGFRNIAVHEYQSLNIDILRYVIETGHMDLVRFCEKMGIRIKVE